MQTAQFLFVFFSELARNSSTLTLSVCWRAFVLSVHVHRQRHWAIRDMMCVCENHARTLVPRQLSAACAHSERQQRGYSSQPPSQQQQKSRFRVQGVQSAKSRSHFIMCTILRRMYPNIIFRNNMCTFYTHRNTEPSAVPCRVHTCSQEMFKVRT